MIAQTFTFKAKDKTEIFVYKWMPEKGIKGIVQIAHGIGEHGGRYENFARDLSNSGTWLCQRPQGTWKNCQNRISA